VLPDRRTEAGDAPILVGERRTGRDRRAVLRIEGGRAVAGQAIAQAARSRAALRAGRYHEAVVTAARAARDDPMLAEPHLVAGEALVNLGRDADAVAALRRAVYLRPDYAPAQLLLAGALDRLGEFAAAGHAYRAAAAMVADMTPRQVTEFFGGRDADELVQLCVRLR
jgi:chemotaxis protein methyltransferase CheR